MLVVPYKTAQPAPATSTSRLHCRLHCHKPQRTSIGLDTPWDGTAQASQACIPYLLHYYNTVQPYFALSRTSSKKHV